MPEKIRTSSGEIGFKCSLWRNGKRLENSDGKYELAEFIKGFEIIEALESATIEARFVVEDSAGIMGAADLARRPPKNRPNLSLAKHNKEFGNK